MRTILIINLFIILFMILSMYGCTEVQVKYLPIDLTQKLNENPILPRIKASELQCLSDDTYQKLFDRERLIKEDALTCRAIINTTKEIK